MQRDTPAFCKKFKATDSISFTLLRESEPVYTSLGEMSSYQPDAAWSVWLCPDPQIQSHYTGSGIRACTYRRYKFNQCDGSLHLFFSYPPGIVVPHTAQQRAGSFFVDKPCPLWYKIISYPPCRSGADHGLVRAGKFIEDVAS